MARRRAPKFPIMITVTADGDGSNPVIADPDNVTNDYVATYMLRRIVLMRETDNLLRTPIIADAPKRQRRRRNRHLQASEADGVTTEG